MPDRPAKPSIAELRVVCQPGGVTNRAGAEHWVAHVYLRQLSPYLTRILLKTSITPNGVTVLMILAGVTAGLALLIPGLPGATLALIMGQVQMLLDCCDGEIARWREQYSPKGVFLDKIGHYTAESVIPIALGVRASGWPDVPLLTDGTLTSIWPVLGVLLALFILYNKALNDMVHVSRAAAGLDRLPDNREVGSPQGRTLRSLRSAARFVPFHRAYHSVELTILAFIAAVIDAIAGDLIATRVLVGALVVLAPVVILGHIAAIVTSRRLR
ncbi:MAG: CDP-alcohol phosphatidyltransferase family protein [Candidatus Nanopelagicales bacterium]